MLGRDDKYSIMAKTKNIDVVKEFNTTLQDAKGVVLTDYQGLTHKQLEEFRKALKTMKAEYTIIKNTLLKRAFEGTAFTLPQDTKLEGPTAALVVRGEEMPVLKSLVKTIKTMGLPKIKLGFLFQNLYNEEEVTRISALPTRDVLIAQVVGQMKAPLYGLHNALSWNIRQFVYALEAVKSKKTA